MDKMTKIAIGLCLALALIIFFATTRIAKEEKGAPAVVDIQVVPVPVPTMPKVTFSPEGEMNMEMSLSLEEDVSDGQVPDEEIATDPRAE